MKVGLAILPHFNWADTPSMIVPHLGVATLVGFLKHHGVAARAIDLRCHVQSVPDTHISIIAPDNRFVSEMPTLPLLLPTLDRYFAGCAFDELLHLDTSSKAYERYGLERNLQFEPLLDTLQDLNELVESNVAVLASFDVVGFSVYFSNFYAVMLACMALRRIDPTRTIVVGGPEVTHSRRASLLMLRAGLVDAVIPGDGVPAILGLVRAVESGTPLDRVSGVMTVVDDRLVETLPPTPFPIDELPLPDYSDLDPEHYYHFAYPFATSRGCPFDCNFCAEKNQFGRYRRMSSAGAFRHFERSLRSLRCGKLFCGDSLLNVSDRWLFDLATRIISGGLEVSWSSYLRVTKNRNLISTLARAGFCRALLGIESTSDELLALMRKGKSSEDNVGCIHRFLEEGIPVHASLILGFPGEDRASWTRLTGLLEYLSTYNDGVAKSYRASYRTMGFRHVPMRLLPLGGFVTFPFLLKPMSDVYESPREYGLRVTTHGNRSSEYTHIPDEVHDVISDIPYTFVDDTLSNSELWSRFWESRQFEGADVRLAGLAQAIHTYFSCIRNSDTFVVKDDRPIFAAPCDHGVRYHSDRLDLDIACHHLSGAAVESLNRGITLAALIDECSTGTPAAANEVKHFLAMSAVEGRLRIELDGGVAVR
jgi:hypothetical protein